MGTKKNGAGQRFIKQLRQKAHIDQHDYFSRFDEEHYEKSPKKCLYCGKQIPYKKRFNKFCSSNCAASFNNTKRGSRTLETRAKISETLRGNKNATKEKLLERALEIEKNNYQEEKYCKACGKLLVGSQKVYCSAACQQKQKYREYIERWKKGNEDGLNGEYGISQNIRRYLFEKNNCKCELCGWGEKNTFTNTIPLEVHHKDGDYRNNKETNLQLLCPNCHSLTETAKSHNKNGRKGRKKYDNK